MVGRTIGRTDEDRPNRWSVGRMVSGTDNWSDRRSVRGTVGRIEGRSDGQLVRRSRSDCRLSLSVELSVGEARLWQACGLLSETRGPISGSGGQLPWREESQLTNSH